MKKIKKGEMEEDLEKLKADIQKKGEEIEQLKKTLEELKSKIHGKEEAGEVTELNDMLGEVSKLLDMSFNIFGLPSKGRGTSGGGLSGLINNLSNLAEKSESFQKNFDINGKEGVIDFRIRSGPLKRTTARHRGQYIGKPLKKKVGTQQESFSPETVEPIVEREPIVDIFEEEDNVIVMVELPSVAEKDIDWNVEGNTLTIKAGTSNRKYYKEIILPKTVEKKGVESTYRNGILEVKLREKSKESIEKT